MFPVILHKLHRVLSWQCLLVSFRVVWSVTEGRGEPGQSMFSGTCSGTRQTAGQRQLGTVVFLAGVLAAFLAVSEQLPLPAADVIFFSSHSLLSMASLKLSASNRSLIAQGDEACCIHNPTESPYLPAWQDTAQSAAVVFHCHWAGRSCEALSTEMCCSLLRGQDPGGHWQVKVRLRLF